MKYDYKEVEKFFLSTPPEKIEELNKAQAEQHKRQTTEFKEAYEKEMCYLCGKSFKIIDHNKPCLHWLLRRAKFKKKDFPKIFDKYGYYNIAAFLRWCANQERFISNINDLIEEKAINKILSYTIKWKNIEWTFDCSLNDFNGHSGTATDFPHYHFQMRIDEKQFINFNDFHIPFKDEDLFSLTISMNENTFFRQDFGNIGTGMQEAVDIDPERLIEHLENTPEEDATYHLSTLIEAIDKPIPGKILDEIRNESRKSGKSMALIAKEKLEGIANVTTIIEPAENIPDIAKRTKRKK